MQLFRLIRRRPNNTFLKNFIFGVEDSLVSTVGLLAGVSAAQASNKAVITTGLVLIVVEGFSMGIGSFLTEETTEEMAGEKPDTVDTARGALTMLGSYILAGLIPLSPYAFTPSRLAMPLSILFSLFGLFLLGYFTSRFYLSPKPWLRAVRMCILGGLAVVAGVIVGKLFHL